MWANTAWRARASVIERCSKPPATSASRNASAQAGVCSNRSSNVNCSGNNNANVNLRLAMWIRFRSAARAASNAGPAAARAAPTTARRSTSSRKSAARRALAASASASASASRRSTSACAALAAACSASKDTTRRSTLEPRHGLPLAHAFKRALVMLRVTRRDMVVGCVCACVQSNLWSGVCNTDGMLWNDEGHCCGTMRVIVISVHNFSHFSSSSSTTPHNFSTTPHFRAHIMSSLHDLHSHDALSFLDAFLPAQCVTDEPQSVPFVDVPTPAIPSAITPASPSSPSSVVSPVVTSATTLCETSIATPVACVDSAAVTPAVTPAAAAPPAPLMHSPFRDAAPPTTPSSPVKPSLKRDAEEPGAPANHPTYDSHIFRRRLKRVKVSLDTGTSTSPPTATPSMPPMPPVERDPATRKFACPSDGCGKSFSSLSNLRQHYRPVHQGLRIPCTRGCDRTFSVPSSLKTHIRDVHDRIPYPCPKGCGRMFDKQVSMKRHGKECKHTR
jgi:hypothetical protein